MKAGLAIPAFVLALCTLASAASAVESVPFNGPYPGSTQAPEPNRLTTSPRARDGNTNNSSLYPYLGMMPYAAPPPVRRERTGPGFLNADPFDPNSVVNSYERNLYANPYPYDPTYNPYGQAPSAYAPRGGAGVPMGNGIPYGR
jgi:hypothetical protein